MEPKISVDEWNQAMKDSRFKKYSKYFTKLVKLATKAGFKKVDQSFIEYLTGLIEADILKKEKAKLKEIKKSENELKSETPIMEVE